MFAHHSSYYSFTFNYFVIINNFYYIHIIIYKIINTKLFTLINYNYLTKRIFNYYYKINNRNSSLGVKKFTYSEVNKSENITFQVIVKHMYIVYTYSEIAKLYTHIKYIIYKKEIKKINPLIFLFYIRFVEILHTYSNFYICGSRLRFEKKTIKLYDFI